LRIFGHIFEYLGHKFYKYGDDREVDRHIIGVILWAILALATDQLSKLWAETSAALDALRYGEVKDILKPGRRSSHGLRHTLLNQRMMAICYANFLHVEGMPKRLAMQKVADAYGVDYETVRTWERKSVPEALDVFVYFKEYAKGAGEWERLRQAGEVAADAVPSNTGVHSLHKLLTGKTLEEHGREYKDALRQANHNRRTGENVG
jgi:hypothetical protein